MKCKVRTDRATDATCRRVAGEFVFGDFRKKMQILALVQTALSTGGNAEAVFEDLAAGEGLCWVLGDVVNRWMEIAQDYENEVVVGNCFSTLEN